MQCCASKSLSVIHVRHLDPEDRQFWRHAHVPRPAQVFRSRRTSRRSPRRSWSGCSGCTRISTTSTSARWSSYARRRIWTPASSTSSSLCRWAVSSRGAEKLPFYPWFSWSDKVCFPEMVDVERDYFSCEDMSIINERVKLNELSMPWFILIAGHILIALMYIQLQY